MPRGMKFDRFETDKAYRMGLLIDNRERSFIGRAPDGSLHDMLYGEDKTRRRREVLEAAKGLCQGCAPPHYVGEMGEWDHIQGGLTGRCDCKHNSRWVCEGFHRKRHVHLMSGKEKGEEHER